MYGSELLFTVLVIINITSSFTLVIPAKHKRNIRSEDENVINITVQNEQKPESDNEVEIKEPVYTKPPKNFEPTIELKPMRENQQKSLEDSKVPAKAHIFYFNKKTNKDLEVQSKPSVFIASILVSLNADNTKTERRYVILKNKRKITSKKLTRHRQIHGFWG